MAEFYARLHMAKEEEFTAKLTVFTGGWRALLFYEPSRKGGQRFLTRDRPLYRYFHLTLYIIRVEAQV